MFSDFFEIFRSTFLKNLLGGVDERVKATGKKGFS